MSRDGASRMRPLALASSIRAVIRLITRDDPPRKSSGNRFAPLAPTTMALPRRTPSSSTSATPSRRKASWAAHNATDLESAQSEATGLMRKLRGLRPGQDEDFEFFTSNSLVAILKDSTTNLRLATIAIGLMTLLGAAIGLMNIMLVSVTERTREIGVRMAIGAKPATILLQFLIEALSLAMAGGLLGVVIGLGTAFWLAARFGWPMLVQPEVIGVSVSFSAAVGVVFGLYPARKASLLDPIEALRYE